MSRFIALYQMPDDPAGFEQSYRDTHLPLVNRTPGLVHVELSRVVRTLRGEQALLLMAVMTFASVDAVSAAMGSAEWKAAGRNLAQIGGLEVATMFLVDEPEVVFAGPSTDHGDQSHGQLSRSIEMSTTKRSAT